MPLLAVLCAGAAAAGTPGGAYRLDRVSVDGAGGGVSEGQQYQIVLAFGQHDADAVAAGGPYVYRGGVFAMVPSDTLFIDGFED
jgi:hypothetical protein